MAAVLGFMGLLCVDVNALTYSDNEGVRNALTYGIPHRSGLIGVIGSSY
jgi:hypothetical protein